MSRAWEKEKILSPHEESNLRLSDSVLGCPTTEPQRLRWAQNPKVWGSIPHGDSEVILFPSLVTRRKTSFSFFFIELKTYQISYSIYKHYAIDVANPSKCIQCILRTRTVRERDWLSRERPENQHRVSWLGRRSNCLHQFECRLPYFIPKWESHRVLRKGT